MLVSFPIYEIVAQPQNFHFTELNQETGLSELSTSYFFTDSRGFTWIGTRGGLNRFDGKRIKVYQPKLSNGSIDPNLSSKVFEDTSGELWFTTSNGIYNWSPDTDSLKVTQIDEDKHGMEKPNYHLFCLDSDNQLWLSAYDSLYVLDIQDGQFQKKINFKSSWAYPHIDAAGKLVGVSQPLPRYGLGIEYLQIEKEQVVSQDTFFSVRNNFEYPAAYTVFYHVENDSTVWLPSDIGLIKFNPMMPNKYKVFKPSNFSSNMRFSDARSGKDGKIWVASKKGGLFLFDTKSERFIQNNSSIWVENRYVDIQNINNLHLDSNQNLWISIWGKGVFVSNLGIVKFEHILVPSNQIEESTQSVTAITKNNPNDIWMGIEGAGLIRFEKDKNGVPFFNLSDKQFLERGKQPVGFLNEPNGDTWVVTPSTLYYWAKLNNQLEIKATRRSGIRKIDYIGKEHYALLTNNELFIFNKNKAYFDLVNTKPALTFDNVYLFYVDNQYHIYISDGIDQVIVYQYQQNQLKALATLSGVGYVNEIATDENNEFVWMASNKGLIKMNQNDFTFEFQKDADKILSNSFNCVFVDEKNKVWLSANHGIVMFDPKKNLVNQYGSSDGVPSTQFMMRSGFQNKKGKIYFGNKNGLVTFHPDSIKLNQTLPQIHITNLTINDNDTLQEKDILVAKQKTFPYSENTLSFTFAAIEYSAPEENQFKYYLEGYDKDTVYNGTEGFARYPNLPAGDYTLNVWGSNSDDVWTTAPKQLAITILPPWYETWWFRTLFALGILGIIYAIYRYRVAQIQKEANYKQLVAETETAVLRLQMNPHFIFNSMNSISSYIMQKDMDNAHDFLARFARLMRNILNSSEKQFHSVEEEIELLQQYMDIEKRRFKDPFEYEFKIENIEDTDDILLPTMILQPFVENAIWHGVATKGGDGKITIFFDIVNTQLVCGVIDNGIGRKATQNFNTKQHESKAISITQKRLALLKKDGQLAPILQIDDLTEGQQTGTKVLIHIPMAYLD